MSKFNLVVMTASNCGPCKHFKNSGLFEKVKQEVTKLECISNFININFDNYMTASLDTELPNKLRKYVGSFPALMIVEEQGWVNISDNSKPDPVVYTFNFEITESGIKPKNITLVPEILIPWINEKVKEYENNLIKLRNNNDGLFISNRKRRDYNLIN